MGFQLSKEVDQDKVFFVKRSELDDRYDPEYYDLKRETINHFIYSAKRIGNSFLVKDGDHDKLPMEDIVSEGRRYLRAQDLKDNMILSKKPIFVSEAYFERVKRCHIYPGDLLFSIMASIGASAIVPEDFPVCTANRAVGILRNMHNSQFITEYVQALLNTNLGITLLELQKRGGLQKRINLADIQALRLPAPQKTIQKKIVRVYENGRQQNKTKEAEAQRLLDSIDDYLLQELAIERPKEGKNTIQERMFFRKFNEVSGGRFDPLFHSGGLYGFMGKVRYEMHKFSSMTHYMKSGFAAGKDEQSRDSVDIIQIRPTNITAEGQFVFARNVYIETAELKNHKNDLLEAGEILFNNTNSQEQVGKTVYFDKEENFFCSNHITRIKTVENLDAQYCTSLFNFYKKNKVFFKLCTNWNNQSGIGLDVLAQVYIPLPPIAKQQEIADHIEHIRNKAKGLRKQAAADLEQAKQEVEAMILGGDKK